MKPRHKSALIIGLGLFGRAAGERLTRLGWEVAGIDRSSSAVQEMRDVLGHVVQMDASDESALASLGVETFDACLVTVGADVEGSVLLVLNLQQLDARRIVAKATSPHHARILRRLGVDEIVFPEQDAGYRLADRLHAPNLLQWVNLRGDREIGVLSVPEHRAGEALGRWRELQAAGVKVLGRLSADGECLPPDPESPLEAGESLVVVASMDQILSLAR